MLQTVLMLALGLPMVPEGLPETVLRTPAYTAPFLTTDALIWQTPGTRGLKIWLVSGYIYASD